MKIFHESPGMTGLCISAAYSATLSTLSTGLNSFATVAFKVFILTYHMQHISKSFFQSVIKREFSNEDSIKYQRIFMFCFGFVIVIFAYSLMYLPDTIVGLGVEFKIANMN